MKLNKDAVRTVRIITRIWGAASLLFLAVMIIGHLFPFPDEIVLPDLVDMIAMVFFPTGVTIGLITIWKNEYLGGFITVFSILIFYLLVAIPRLAFAVVPTTLLITAPGFLSLWLSQQKKRS